MTGRIRSISTSLAVFLLTTSASAVGAADLPFLIQTIDSHSLAGSLVAAPSGGFVATLESLGGDPAYYVGGTGAPIRTSVFAQVGGTWAPRASTPPTDLSFPHAIIVGSDGWMHTISWQNPATDYSRPLLQDESGTGWTSTVLDTSAVAGMGIALDSQNQIWVAYLRVRRINCCWGAPFELVVAKRTQSGWSRDSLAVPACPPMTPYPFAVDSFGRPHLLFAGPDKGLYHSVRLATGWQTTQVDSEASTVTTNPLNGAAPQLQLAADGTPHVLYRVGSIIRHAQLSAGSWERDSLPYPLAFGTQAMALDHAGRPRVAYYGLASPGYGFDCRFPLVLALDTGGTWTDVPISCNPPNSAAGVPLTLRIDANDRATVCFQGPNSTDVSIATLAQAAAVGPASSPAGLRIGLVSHNPQRPGETAMWAVSLADPAVVTLEAFDLAGRRLATSSPRSVPPGGATIAWSPSPIVSGGYFVRATTPGGHSRAVHLIVTR